MFMYVYQLLSRLIRYAKVFNNIHTYIYIYLYLFIDLRLSVHSYHQTYQIGTLADTQYPRRERGCSAPLIISAILEWQGKLPYLYSFKYNELRKIVLFLPWVKHALQ